jgi:hypothetical protein
MSVSAVVSNRDRRGGGRGLMLPICQFKEIGVPYKDRYSCLPLIGGVEKEKERTAIMVDK